MLLVLFLGLGLAGLFFYFRVRPILAGLEQVFVTPVPASGTPAEVEPTPNPLEDPVNILLIGIDRRDDVTHTLNDVDIVIHIDPAQKFASMLSIPRDTLVNIPGAGNYKINAAYGLGEELFADSGGGPGLCRRTVEQFLDIRIDYFAEVDFHGFERIVDLLGGINVDVPKPLVDNEYPTEDYGYTRIYIPAGLQHMDGQTALQYVRSRHQDSDLGRNRRQQQVLLAIRDRFLQTDLLTDWNRLEALAQELGGNLKTDIPRATTLPALVRLAPKIGSANTVSYALTMQNCLVDEDAHYNLIPDVACVQEMARKMQENPLLQEEAAVIQVLNGTIDCLGCAGRTQEFLRQQGLPVTDRAADAPNQGTYTTTLVLDSGDHAYTRGRLMELLGVTGTATVELYSSQTGQADIVLIIGPGFQPPE